MLWRKMFRDILENKVAYIACAIVIAIGLMTYTSMSIAKDGLFNAKDQFYQEYSFADGFAKVKAIPITRAQALEEIDGIDVVSGRLVKDVRVLMPDTEENVYLRLISLNAPEGNELNGIKLEKGTFPSTNRQQILVADKFYEAHQLQIGNKINVIIEGKQVELSVSGTGMSPEYIYALKELQSVASDPLTFEVAYVPYEDMEQLFNQKGLVNDISFTLKPGVTYEDVEQAVKSDLERYELESLYAAKDQLSNAMLTEELKQLERMASSLPVIFLIIAAIILYIMLKRLVESQRGQIGTLKAFGYRRSEILFHYLWYGIFIGIFGGVLGGVLGIWVSKYYLQIYQMFFNLPNIGAHTSMKYFYLGIIMAVLFSAVASFQGVRGVIRLQPAEAMHPVVPTFVKKTFLEKIPGFWRAFNVQGRMAIRNLLRNKNRSIFTLIGMIFTFSMMASFFSLSSMSETMIMDQFTRVQKQDVKLTFVKPMPRSDVIRELNDVDGVKRVEPFLEIPVSLKFLNHKKDVIALGISVDSELYNVFDKEGNRLEVPKSGMMVSEQVADKLGVQVGDVLQVESIFAKDEKLNIKIEKIIPQYLGANIYMNQDALLGLLKQGEMMTSALIAIDKRAMPSLKDEYRASKYISTIEVRQEMIDKYEELMGSATYAMWVMAIISIITGFAIVYNSSIISLAERKRELASLRVMGMTPKEVMEVVSVEQWFIGFSGMIAGIPLAFLMNQMMSTSMSNDLYTIPPGTSGNAIVLAFIGTIFAIAVSQASISRKVKQLDLVAVLKERE
ncbi:FtsX-like permease family protein [Schinkia azotoformans]|uniref:ABC transporter permease n=1 Tax=Schinkia azotoformans LMG 9581 TaxID=1131731 RepID=K6DS11_SCHAZ|nr:ABC transporter permease [Schinkia azotoformans]EKN71144.1 hypothetical protein BAZO_00640 [Schinkia azotoformans LMG 9581]MEC1640329.1 FtsX-like permease family protein [Schinkia azotoformans]MEC1947391.1 FtsX-like permease family protein [Schinkia azotoformans]